MIVFTQSDVLRVSEVAEGDLGGGVSPNQIHAVSRSWLVTRVANRTIRPNPQPSPLDLLHVL